MYVSVAVCSGVKREGRSERLRKRKGERDLVCVKALFVQTSVLLHLPASLHDGK